MGSQPSRGSLRHSAGAADPRRECRLFRELGTLLQRVERSDQKSNQALQLKVAKLVADHLN